MIKCVVCKKEMPSKTKRKTCSRKCARAYERAYRETEKYKTRRRAYVRAFRQRKLMRAKLQEEK